MIGTRAGIQARGGHQIPGLTPGMGKGERDVLTGDHGDRSSAGGCFAA